MRHFLFFKIKTRFRSFYSASQLFLLILPLWLFSACAVHPEPEAPFVLTLLHTNDVHGEYSGLDIHGQSCEAAICEGGVGGSIRLDQAVAALRRDFPVSLLLDAGDQFQGTFFFTLHRETIVADIMNTLEYDAMVPGNHEFDDGCDPFFNLFRNLRTPVVAANLSLSGDANMSKGMGPWVIVTKANRRVGIIGLVHPDTPEVASPCVEATFSDPAAALRRSVAELTDQGVNIIIVLSHIGLDADLSLASDVAGVDVIVGGHSHLLLSNEDPNAVGPYPLVVSSPGREPVLVVTAGSRLMRLGRLDVEFDPNGRATCWQGEPIFLDDKALTAINAPLSDSSLVRKMTAYAAPIQSLKQTPIGRIIRENPDDRVMERARTCRRQECLTGNILADALLDFLKPEVQAVLINGGGVRGVFPNETVTELDLFSVVPFDNTVVTAKMPGHVVLAMLEHGLSGYENTKGRFLLPAGLRYTFDAGLPAGKRLISATIQDENGKWYPVEPDRVYAIGTLSYLAEGGDGYSLLTKLNWNDTGVLVRDGVKACFLRNFPLFPRIDGRIREVGAGLIKDQPVRYQAFPR